MKKDIKTQMCPKGDTEKRKTLNERNKYEVNLFWTQQNRATVIIEATSLLAVKRKADAIQSEDIENWNPVAGELNVESVEPCSENRIRH
jgi:hypothetical protein